MAWTDRALRKDGFPCTAASAVSPWKPTAVLACPRRYELLAPAPPAGDLAGGRFDGGDPGGPVIAPFTDEQAAP